MLLKYGQNPSPKIISSLVVVVDGLEPLGVLADEAEESRPEGLQGLEHRQGHRALLHGHPEVPASRSSSLVNQFQKLH